MKFLAAFNLILPYSLIASSAANLDVDETRMSKKNSNLKLLMKSHSRLAPVLEHGLERHLILKNEKKTRRAQEFLSTCFMDLLQTLEVQLELEFSGIVSETPSPVCSEDGTSCTEDWSDVDLSAGQDLCKQNNLELYVVNADLDGCTAATDDFVNVGDDFFFNNTADDFPFNDTFGTLNFGDEFSFNATDDYKYSEAEDSGLSEAVETTIDDFSFKTTDNTTDDYKYDSFNSTEDYKYTTDEPDNTAESLKFIDKPVGCMPASCDMQEIEDLFLDSYDYCGITMIESLYLYGEDPSSSGSMHPFDKKNQGMGMCMMIAGIFGAYL